MILYLCRHGTAVDGDEDTPDENRWLTAGGRREVQEVGAVLRAEGEVPKFIRTSPLVRAVQTAAELAGAFGFEREVAVLAGLAPGGRLGGVLRALEEFPSGASVALVGHEPQMSDWSAALLGRHTLGRSFQKGGVLRLNFDGHPEPGKGRSVFYLSPQHLKPIPI